MNKKQLIVAYILLLFLHSQAFASDKIKIVWVDQDGEYFVNEEYIKSAPAPIKAILSYYSLKGGINCWWDGDEPNEDWDNINCGLTQALGLGYQCGQKQLDFINTWFKDQQRKFTVEDCSSALETATYSNRLPFLELEILGDVVSVRYESSYYSVREAEFWEHWGRDTFKVYPDKVVILQRMKFKEDHYFVDWVSGSRRDNE